MKIVIILPTYNERDNIRTVIDKIRQEVKSYSNHRIIILVVDDNSPDNTAAVVADIAKKDKDLFLISGQKQGLGQALLRGMQYAVDKINTDIIIQMDADLSHDPVELPNFIDALDKADFVIGSRYIKGGSIPHNWGLHRKIFSIVGNEFVRFGLGILKIHDWTGGYRAYRRIYYEKVREHMAKYRGYVFQIAFLHKAVLNQASIVEVPIKFIDRKYGKSKIAPSEYIKNVIEYVVSYRYLTLKKSRVWKFAVVGTIGFIINTIVLELGVRLGLHPAAGSVLGAECAIVSNFLLNNSWTFRDDKISGLKLIIKFIHFNLSSLNALIIQSATVWIGTHLTGVSKYRYWYIAGVGLGMIWNYWAYTHLIWKKPKSK